MLNFDDIHFEVAKKKSQFHIKTWVGPFICNTRSTGEEVDKILKEMKFNLIFTWYHDPLGIISKLRVENKNTLYIHTPRLQIEKFVNQLVWAENTLQLFQLQLYRPTLLKRKQLKYGERWDRHQQQVVRPRIS